MRARTLEKLLAENSHRSEAWMDLLSRGLRAHELLPNAGRGSSAPDIDADGAAAFVIATANAETGRDAAEAVREFWPLVPAFPAIESASSFGAELSSVLSSEEKAAQIERIVCARFTDRANQGPVYFAEINYRFHQYDQLNLQRYYPSKLVERSNGVASFVAFERFGMCAISPATIIGGRLIRLVAAHLGRRGATSDEHLREGAE